jgi:methyltransferase-like protein 6
MYISTEFNRWLTTINEEQGALVEIGCGHGSTMFPLLHTYLDISYLATDISSNALELLQRDSRYNPTRAQLLLWDPTLAPIIPSSVVLPKLFGCLIIFTLSAVSPDHHKDFMLNVKSSLARDSVILFRDYGLYDMTMFRHGNQVYGTKCYRRKDGTLSFYFDLNYVKTLVEACGLEIIELNYATVCLKNRRTGKDLHRVFVHGVFKRK